MKWLYLCAMLLAASTAWAGSQDFDWLVDPVPEIPAGSVESKFIESYVPMGHPASSDDDSGVSQTVATQGLTRNGFRFFYGITNHVALMYQLNLARPDGQSYQYEGSEFGAHIRIYEGYGWKVGAALEVEWQREPQYVDNELDIDFHPMVERDFGPVSVLLNPIIEKNLVGPDAGFGLDAGYAAQVLYHFSERYAAGIESYGDKGRLTHGGSASQNQDYYLMPVMNAQFGALKFSTGPGFGLTSASDQMVLKFNVEYSFALFPRE